MLDMRRQFPTVQISPATDDIGLQDPVSDLPTARMAVAHRERPRLREPPAPGQVCSPTPTVESALQPWPAPLFVPGNHRRRQRQQQPRAPPGCLRWRRSRCLLPLCQPHGVQGHRALLCLLSSRGCWCPVPALALLLRRESAVLAPCHPIPPKTKLISNIQPPWTKSYASGTMTKTDHSQPRTGSKPRCFCPSPAAAFR